MMKPSRLDVSASVTAETEDENGAHRRLVWNAALQLKQHTQSPSVSSPPDANRAVTSTALLIRVTQNQRRRSQARLWLRRAAGLNQRRRWRGSGYVFGREHDKQQREPRSRSVSTGVTADSLHLTLRNSKKTTSTSSAPPPLFLIHSVLPFTASGPFN